VANALHKNPLWPVVPCHRVVCSDGSFGGSKNGAEGRRNSVAKEGIPIENGKVKLSSEILC
jgi:O6-methylguanine-DNA--protein-cysteine methyltransferase